MQILIVDDDAGIRWVLAKVLREMGVEHIEEADTLAKAKEVQKNHSFDLCFLDVFLPDGSGMEALEAGEIQAPAILMTAETTFDNATNAYRAGALEYLPKPFDLDEVRHLVQRMAHQAPPPSDVAMTSAKDSETFNDEMIVGRSPEMQDLFRMMGRVATSDLTVLITGESGTGKERVAHALHQQSRRSKKTFIAINTAAIPAELLEAELFGHKRGAFTGAERDRSGLFEQADGGTLFLDEIGDMPQALQAKLLRVLEEGKVQRIGDNKPIPVNVRLLAATHQDLQKKMDAGLFRVDLYYRLNVIPVHIPPLRERTGDIPTLAAHMLDAACAELNQQQPILLDDALDLLVRHDWPGNVRELKNVMRRLVVMTPGVTITLTDVALALGGLNKMEEKANELPDAVERSMQRYINQLGYGQVRDLYKQLLTQIEPALLKLTLRHCGGNQVKVSEALGLNRNTVRKLLQKYEIDPTFFRRH
ncbi:MAG: sigma-54 dependent transcriptional regulator [Mariprofundaceae bacterium]